MIGKLSFVLLLALCAFQVQTRSVEPQKKHDRALDDIIKVITDIINKIQDIIGQITSNLPQFLKDLEAKIKEIIAGLNLDDLIAKIKEHIENILGAGEHVKACVEAQSEAIKQLALDQKAGAQACVEATQAKVQDLQNQIQSLLAKVNELRQHVVDSVEKCYQDNHLNPTGLIECLKAQVDPIKAELQEIEKEVETLIATTKQVVQQTGQELSTCMNTLAQDFSVKEQAIIEEIKTCMSTAPQPQQKHDRALDDILKVIQEIINKIRDIIGQITSNIPQFLKDLEAKIKEIIAGLNLDDLIAKIKEQIEKILGAVGEHAKKCVEAQSEAIKQLALDEQAGAQACVQAAEAKVQDLQEQIQSLLTKANELRQHVVDSVEKCYQDNHLNPAGLFECLKAQVDPIKAELQEIQKAVETLIATAKQVALEAGQELSTCMNNLAQDLSVKEQAIIEEIKNCMLQPKSTVHQQKQDRALDDIIKVIQDLINKIHDIIGQITSNLPQFLKDLEDKIKEIIAGLNLDDIIAKIKEQIENILGQVGAHVKECVDAQSEAITQLALDEQAGAQACVQAAQAKTEELQKQIQNLLTRANEIRQHVVDSVEKCFQDNHLNPAGLFECLKAQVDPIKGELKQMEKEVEALIATAKQVVQEAGQELSTCMNALAQDLSVKEQAIIEEIKKCILSQ